MSKLIKIEVFVSDSCLMCGEYEQIVDHLFSLVQLEEQFGLLQCVVLEWILINPNQRECDQNDGCMFSLKINLIMKLLWLWQWVFYDFYGFQDFDDELQSSRKSSYQ